MDECFYILKLKQKMRHFYILKAIVLGFTQYEV